MAEGFNEDSHSNNMQELMLETGLFDVFDETSSVDKQHRDPTFECGSKGVDFFINWWLLRCVKGIGLIERNEISESDNRGFLIDIDMANYFSKELVEGNVKVKRRLNPNSVSNRKVFVETFDEILNVTNVEN